MAVYKRGLQVEPGNVQMKAGVATLEKDIQQAKFYAELKATMEKAKQEKANEA